eukprot:718016-Pyramimonas_sp.AAC.1
MGRRAKGSAAARADVVSDGGRRATPVSEGGNCSGWPRSGDMPSRPAVVFEQLTEASVDGVKEAMHDR